MDFYTHANQIITECMICKSLLGSRFTKLLQHLMSYKLFCFFDDKTKQCIKYNQGVKEQKTDLEKT